MSKLFLTKIDFPRIHNILERIGQLRSDWVSILRSASDWNCFEHKKAGALLIVFGGFPFGITELLGEHIDPSPLFSTHHTLQFYAGRLQIKVLGDARWESGRMFGCRHP